MASTDARPVPRKNAAYRITFPILDADGDLVTGATGLDSEVSKDAGTFADCTNEATEIATSSGMYYLDLTSTEMNADCVAVIVKTSSSGAKTTPVVLYPEEAGDIRVNVTQVNSDTTTSTNLFNAYNGTGYTDGTAQAGANGSITLTAGSSAVTNFYKGLIIALEGGTGAGQSRLITASDGTTKVATIAPNWATNPDSSTTYSFQPWTNALCLVDTDGTYTLQQAMSVVLAALSGVTSSAGAVIKTPSGSNTRITATIDGSNNRTVMSLTPSS